MKVKGAIIQAFACVALDSPRGKLPRILADPEAEENCVATPSDVSATRPRDHAFLLTRSTKTRIWWSWRALLPPLSHLFGHGALDDAASSRAAEDSEGTFSLLSLAQ